MYRYAGVDLSTLGAALNLADGVAGAPPVRGKNLVIPYSHGQRPTTKYYDERPIVLHGLITGASGIALEAAEDAIKKLFPIGAGEQKLERLMADGSLRYVMAEVRNSLVVKDALMGAKAAKWSIELVASDPFWYGSTPECSQSRQAWFLDGAQAAPVLSEDFETPDPNFQTLFRSLGNDATGTLNAWTQSAGIWAIASNLVTNTFSGNDLQLTAGHADWGDCIFQLRFKYVANSLPGAIAHFTNPTTYIFGGYSGAGLILTRRLPSGFTTVASAPWIPVNGTFYWFQLTCSGTSYTISVFADSAGAMGALIATATGTITDAAVQSGQVGLRDSGSVASAQFGGPFANVCQVTGPAPKGWLTNSNGGEPAYCWSKVNPYAGSSSLSIYHPHVSAQGRWLSSTVLPIGTCSLTIAARGTMTLANIFNWDGVGARSNLIFAPTAGWARYVSVPDTTTAPSEIYLQGDSVGYVYFDGLSVLPGAIGSIVNLDDGAHWLDQSNPYFAQMLTSQVSVVEATNAGDIFTRKALFTLAGPMVNPKLTNLRNGQSLQVNLTMLAGHTMVIDCGAQTVTIDGALQPLSAVVLGPGQSDWMHLEAGENSLKIDLGAPPTVVAYQAQYSPAYL